MRLSPGAGRSVEGRGNYAETRAWERFGSIENGQLAGADPQKPWWGLMVHGLWWESGFYPEGSGEPQNVLNKEGCDQISVQKNQEED